MGNFFIGLFQNLIDGFAVTGKAVLEVLPASPFSKVEMLKLESELFSNIAWLIPISYIMSITSFWLLAIASYYIYQIILRWIKVVG